MKSEVLSNFPWTDLTAVGFFIFMSLFAFYVYWAMKRSNKELFDDASRIPFQEGEKVNSNNIMKQGLGHE
jgi:cbb3-type cytochrome oxidase subunit 3